MQGYEAGLNLAMILREPGSQIRDHPKANEHIIAKVCRLGLSILALSSLVLYSLAEIS